jgi:tripartite ATP-independent transporter DctP family solute receptor
MFRHIRGVEPDDGREKMKLRGFQSAASLALSAAFGGMVFATSVMAAEPIVLKYSVVFPPAGAQGAGAEQLETFIEDYSDGALDFQFFPSAQLGDKLQSLEGLRNGSIEMSEASAADLGNYSKLWDIFSLPFLFNNGNDAIRVITDPRVASILNADAEAQGFKIIGWWNLGERSVINSVRPVETPEDLNGIKIRVMQNPMLAEAITAMGATGIPMAWSEVYTAVQQGAIDGLENSPPVISSNKMYEVAKFYSMTQQFIIPDPQMISLIVYNALSPELQEAVLKAGEASQNDFNAKWDAAMVSEMAFLKEQGVQVNEVDKEAFRAAVTPLVEEFLASASPETTALYDAIVLVRDGG